MGGFEMWAENSPVQKLDRFSLVLFVKTIMDGYKINRVLSPIQVRHIDIKLKSSTQGINRDMV